MMPAPAINMKGVRCGRLVVTARAPTIKSKDGRSKAYWTCRCDCGATVAALGCDLRIGKIRSCGCLRRDTARAAGSVSAKTRKARKLAAKDVAPKLLRGSARMKELGRVPPPRDTDKTWADANVAGAELMRLWPLRPQQHDDASVSAQ